MKCSFFYENYLKTMFSKKYVCNHFKLKSLWFKILAVQQKFNQTFSFRLKSVKKNMVQTQMAVHCDLHILCSTLGWKNWNRNKVLVTLTQVLGQIGFSSENKWFKCEGTNFTFFTYISYELSYPRSFSICSTMGQRILKLRSYFLNPHSTYHEIFSILSNNVKIAKM